MHITGPSTARVEGCRTEPGLYGCFTVTAGYLHEAQAGAEALSASCQCHVCVFGKESRTRRTRSIETSGDTLSQELPHLADLWDLTMGALRQRLMLNPFEKVPTHPHTLSVLRAFALR